MHFFVRDPATNDKTYSLLQIKKQITIIMLVSLIIGMLIEKLGLMAILVEQLLRWRQVGTAYVFQCGRTQIEINRTTSSAATVPIGFALSRCICFDPPYCNLPAMSVVKFLSSSIIFAPGGVCEAPPGKMPFVCNQTPQQLHKFWHTSRSPPCQTLSTNVA